LTRDKFDEAAAIKSQIDRLLAIDTLLTKASTSRHLLAAIDEYSYGKVTVLNKECMPEELLQDFRQAIAFRVLKLDKAFEAL
jgi:hypothetical protein